MILSASRRTDIPAFYTPWFMNRVNEGFLYVRNPFNAHQIRKIPLNSSDVQAIVFWTRNPEPLIMHLQRLNDFGFKYYFQYTITGYPKALERAVPRPLSAIETFKKLSEAIGSGKVVWRYDPILISNLTDYDEHRRRFEKISEALSGFTKRIVVSFADFYKKTETGLKCIPNFNYKDALDDLENTRKLALFMANIAKTHGMSIQTCSEAQDFSPWGIPNGKCIDDELLQKEFGITISSTKDSGQREECGCIKSIDIGQYNTCLHGCSYCYATYSTATVKNNRMRHDPNSPFLIGPPESPSHEPQQGELL